MGKLFTKPYIRFFLLLVLILLFIVLGKFFAIDKEKIDTLFKKIPLVYSALAFTVLYTASNFLILGDLKEILKIVGAIFFGAPLSTLFIYLSEIINASIFFNMSHILGKEFVEKSLKGKFKKLHEKVGDLNFLWLSLLRLNLLIPYRVLDLSLGVTNVSFRKYILAVCFASLPRIFFWQFIFASLGGVSLEKMKLYFGNNPLLCILYLLYVIFSIVVIFKLKKRLK